MISFVARRLLAAVPLLWGVLTLVFLIVQAVPGDPFQPDQGSAAAPGAGERLRHVFGADRPVPGRYLSWLGEFLTGDLGVSYSYRRPVAALLRDAVLNTFVLAGLALLLQFALGTAAGLVATRARRRWVDRSIVGCATALYSVPTFWLGLILAWLLSVQLGWLPASQMRSLDAASLDAPRRIADLLLHLALPCLSLALPAAGGVALYVRDELKALLRRGFIRNARARGVTERATLLRHGLKNALLPVVNLFGTALPALLGGSVVIEVLFAWPGMGRLAYQAVLSRDEPLILGCTWVASVAVVCGSLVADLVSAAIDPRVRESLP
ncbi:MAG: ABC transporter permease [Acidobacteria bacterium]|nr:ABC transporter permease [Acidobacteriota bacterium]